MIDAPVRMATTTCGGMIGSSAGNALDAAAAIAASKTPSWNFLLLGALSGALVLSGISVHPFFQQLVFHDGSQVHQFTTAFFHKNFQSV